MSNTTNQGRKTSTLGEFVRERDFFLTMEGHRELHRQLALKRFFDRREKAAANDNR